MYRGSASEAPPRERKKKKTSRLEARTSAAVVRLARACAASTCEVPRPARREPGGVLWTASLHTSCCELGADLRGASLRDADMGGVDLSGAWPNLS